MSRAASTVEAMEESVADVCRRFGIGGLVAVPPVGRTLAVTVADLVERGHWRWLEWLRGVTGPGSILASVAGVGPGLATRLDQELDIEMLEALELVSHVVGWQRSTVLGRSFTLLAATGATPRCSRTSLELTS